MAKRAEWTWPEIVGAAVCALALVGVAAAVVWGTVERWDSGWVQAVGSILAIMVSAGLVLMQHRLEESRAVESALSERVARMRIIQQVAMSTASNGRWLQRNFANRERMLRIATGTEFFPPDSLNFLSHAVEAITLHELDSPTLVFETRGLLFNARHLKGQIRYLLDNHAAISEEIFRLAFTNIATGATVLEDTADRIRAHVDAVEREGVDALRAVVKPWEPEAPIGWLPIPGEELKT